MLTQSTEGKLTWRTILSRVTSHIVTLATQRVAALRVEVVELASRTNSVRLICADSVCRNNTTVAMMRRCNIHFALHLVDVFLSVLDHLHSLLPFLFECGLSFFYFLLLNLYPTIYLFLLELKSARRHLILIKQLLDVLPFFMLFVPQNVLSEFDKFRVLTILHDDFELFL